MAYVGEYRDRLRDGHGSYVFPGGVFRYEGEWKRGKMHGRGVFSLSDGGSYEGEFLNGEIDGIGLRRWPDGTTYNGQFHHGERHGEGVQIAASGEVYEGHWINNQRHGLGELRMVNGDVYGGDFHHHKPHGNGRIKFARDASTYDGDWVDGVISGRGIHKSAKGKRLYEGEWLHGQKHGKGIGIVAELSSGGDVVYDGVWAHDKPMMPTTTLGFKVKAETIGGSETEYQDAPLTVTVDKKNGFLLPPVIVASLHNSATSDEATIVKEESGRLLRLRVFEGLVPPSQPAEASTSDESGADAPPPPAQWQFIVPRDPALGSDVAKEEKLQENGEESSTPEETRLDEAVAFNSTGIAVFSNLALPSASLIGSYYLVSQSLVGDEQCCASPIYMQLQLVE